MNLREFVPHFLRIRLNKLFGRDRRVASKDFLWDFKRFWAYSGLAYPQSPDALLAKVIMSYHVLEKGLTMPERRLGFGKDVVVRLMVLIRAYVERYGLENKQVCHAIGVLKEYRDLHRTELHACCESEEKFWRTLNAFLSDYATVTVARQMHVTRDDFFSRIDCPFPEFAQSRHTVRNYTQESVPVDKIVEAVKIAMTAPSACNRQYVRVHCITDKDACAQLLSLQKGNRGFGHLANKVIVVTADIEGIDSTGERNDVYTNGGIFLMNLCYALHYCRIAHCILNWSRSEADDNAARELLGEQLKKSETIVAVLSCGVAPKEFDVAASPRKELSEVFVVHGRNRGAL